MRERKVMFRQNPKFEIRNSKQIRNPKQIRIPNDKMTKTNTLKIPCFCHWSISISVIVCGLRLENSTDFVVSARLRLLEADEGFCRVLRRTYMQGLSRQARRAFYCAVCLLTFYEVITDRFHPYLWIGNLRCTTARSQAGTINNQQSSI